MNRLNSAFSAAFKHVSMTLLLMAALLFPATAQQVSQEGYTSQEMIDQGHQFFGNATDGLARVIEKAFESYGLPNGYVLGEEASGAFIGGLTYGEGQMYTKNAGEHPLFWQGPSVGFDYGGQGSRVMMLVYNLQNVDDVYGRFGGVSGQAYAIAGAGMTVLQGGHIVLVPVRTGIGARLGVNIGYLKLTSRPTWNPF
ncbi:MAG: EipA family protein [Rhizobiaceae bacterium]|nr:EipA family protein [Rhizobiaceae bacterium]